MGHTREPLYTTGRLASLLGVSTGIASKLIDGGAVAGFRLPGSGERRAPRSAVVAYLDGCDEPYRSWALGQLQEGHLLVGGQAILVQQLQTCPALQGQQVRACRTLLEAGHWLGQRGPPISVTLDGYLGRALVLEAAAWCHEHVAARLVGLVAEDDGQEGDWHEAGCEAVLRHPVSPEALARAMTGTHRAVKRRR